MRKPTAILPWLVSSEPKSDVQEIARRKTYDEKSFLVWSDGTVTKAFGYFYKGVRKLPVQAALVVSDEVSLFSEDEIPTLLKAAKQLAKKGTFLPGELRTLAHRMLEKSNKPRLTPVWETISADRDGQPTERVWILPKLRWPGLAVWDFTGHQESSGGRYALFRATYENPFGRRRTKEPAWEPTGFRFKNLDELTAHLMQEGGQ